VLHCNDELSLREREDEGASQEAETKQRFRIFHSIISSSKEIFQLSKTPLHVCPHSAPPSHSPRLCSFTFGTRSFGTRMGKKGENLFFFHVFCLSRFDNK
jgi:hypothetical protein